MRDDGPVGEALAGQHGGRVARDALKQPAATYCAACSTSRAPRYRPAATARAAHRSAGTAPAYSCRHDRAAAADAAVEVDGGGVGFAASSMRW